MKNRLHIAVGVIFSQQGDQVLIAKRPAHVHQGGLWEFPGGKLHAGEGVEEALKRELFEELGLVPDRIRPLICIDHDYPAQKVKLDVWKVEQWHGQPVSKEGQQITWAPVDKLEKWEFPEANRTITTAARLPPLYFITPNLESYDAQFLSRMKQYLQAGLKLIQFRCKHAGCDNDAVIGELASLCKEHNAQLMLNDTPDKAKQLGVHGIHLTSERLMGLQSRPLDGDYLVAASCHNDMELEHADRIGVDFCVLGPVNKTSSHPHVTPMGWQQFRKLTQHVRIPVYALGGMYSSDLIRAWESGGQGIAMLSGLWDAEDPERVIRACLNR